MRILPPVARHASVRVALLVASCFPVAFSANSALAATPACDASLLPKLSVPSDTTLTGASLKTTSAALGSVPYCEVAGTIGPAPSAIRFIVGLPTANWNGRFVANGDGGFDGTLALAPDRIAQGYVSANSDSGHVQPQANDASWAYNDRTKEVDYGSRAVDVSTRTAKRIITSFYGQRIQYSYFEGCSTGGRQALMAAQRYPEHFDGIVGGAPAHNLTGLAVEQNWSLRQFLPDAGAPGASTITPAQAAMINAAVLAKCDADDGVKDGLISNPLACSFKAAEVSCAATGGAKDCLSAAQVQAVQNVYDGPSTSWGKRLYPGKPVGSEPGWQFWLLPPLTLQGGFTFSFMNFLFFPNDPGPAPGYHWYDFNFDTDPPRGHPMARILDAVDPDLSDFRRQGAKFLLYHGWGDGLIPATRTVQYYERVVDETGSRARTERFMRFFTVPGMDHCGAFGSGLATWDRLAPLVKWVEQGVAPDRIVATQSLASGAKRTRPLCPYPREARWTGSGSTDDAANFTCVMPAGRDDDDHGRGRGRDRRDDD